MILSPDDITDEINALRALHCRGPAVAARPNEDHTCPDATFTAGLPLSNSEPGWKPPALSRSTLPAAPGPTRGVSSDGWMARKLTPRSGSAGFLVRSPSRTRADSCCSTLPKTSPAWDPASPPDRDTTPSEPPGVALPWLLLAAAAEVLALAVFVCWVAVAAIACGVV